MQLKDLYISFFISKGHKQIPSAPVVPINDPSVLFNTAGMQPLIPYLMGEPHPYGKRLVNYQKCIRTNDLDAIGDTYHHTFFEMLGNWSLGDYFKEESIKWSYEFLIEVLKIDKEKLAVSVFVGDENIPFDEESYNIWLSLGMPKERIVALYEDNFWIAGETGPCGPDTEIFYFRGENPPKEFDPNDERWLEIWNNVFMQYEKHKDGTFTELPNKNVDTGMGVERTVAVLEGCDDNYLSSIWKDVIKKIEELSNKPYSDNTHSMRVIADHIRTAVMIASDNALIKPSNTEQGYILRRLIRRMIRHARKLDIDITSDFAVELANIIVDKYKVYYPELTINYNHMINVLRDEQKKFARTLEKGLRELDKMKDKITDNKLDAKSAFKLYDTYGFPIELTVEMCKEVGISVDIEGFNEAFKQHQELSRQSSQGKFKGGLGGDTVKETRLHTATHLLNAALKLVLDDTVHQKGSNITEERLRFDFSWDKKVTPEELGKVEEIVNNWINEDIKVTTQEMSKEEALASGAECMFIEKYPDIVTVYSIGDISHELCGGPHVKSTKELGKFKIQKEEASSSGVRRIRAILEN